MKWKDFFMKIFFFITILSSHSLLFVSIVVNEGYTKHSIMPTILFITTYFIFMFLFEVKEI
jgi:hypothetical protein